MNYRHLIKTLIFVGLSIILAVVMVEIGAIDKLLHASKEFEYLAALLAGVFFVSIFTTAPAVAVIVELAQQMPILILVIFGGIGALIGDLIIFHFLKDELVDDLNYLSDHIKNNGFFAIFKSRYFRWLAVVLGGLVIASPLPDELGIAIIGISRLKTMAFVPLSLFFNSLGILIVALVGKSL